MDSIQDKTIQKKLYNFFLLMMSSCHTFMYVVHAYRLSIHDNINKLMITDLALAFHDKQVFGTKHK